MNYLMLFLSVCVNAAFSSIRNYLGKNNVKSTCDNYIVNTLTYTAGALLLLILSAATWNGFSLFTVLFGVLFGVATAFSGIFQLKALSTGPMSFTMLIISSSMILPSFSGAILWGEELSVLQVVGTFLMIASAYFTAVKGEGSASVRWLVYVMAAFMFQGSIGIMQKIQQKSPYFAESTPFLTVAFVVSAIICLLFMQMSAKKTSEAKDKPLKNKRLALSLICGGMIAFLNVVNLYLSGVLPSAVLFPVQNGGTTVLSVVCAIAVFRESLTKKKIIGLLIGVVALGLLIL